MSKVFKKVLVSAVKETGSYVELFLNKNEPSGKIQYLNSKGQLITLLSDSDSNIDEEDIVFVDDISKLPKAVGKVRVLKTGKTYILTKNIDLLGDRLETNGVCNILGLSSETSFLTSTGLGIGVPLITSIHTIVIESISFHDVDTCFSINGNTNTIALDWRSVNFINIPNAWLIDTCDNFIFNTCAFLGSQGGRFTGTIGTIALSDSLFRGIGSAGNIIELDANCIITRRFRTILCPIIAFGSTNGINVSTSATIPTEKFILENVEFSGSEQNQYLSGVNDTSNKSLFSKCVGIINTAVNGQMYMQDNTVATTISNTTDFVKVAGVTTASVDNAKYTVTDNKLTNNAVIQRKYLVTCTLSFSSGNNNICQFGFYDSKLGAVREPSKTKATANSAGRAENITMNCVVNHSNTNEIEIHVRNTSSTSNVTVSDMNVVITEIK
jgi:hypothetical protein